jgi:hypothetical protein
MTLCFRVSNAVFLGNCLNRRPRRPRRLRAFGRYVGQGRPNRGDRLLAVRLCGGLDQSLVAVTESIPLALSVMI